MNHFDLMRLVAAVLVVFSHGFNLSHGKVLGKQYEPLMQWSHGQLTLGGLAVLVFFVVSGFLITASFEKDQNLGSFFRKRCLRIYPGLMVVVLSTVFILGPVLTELPLGDYLKKPETYQYLLNNISFLRYQDKLPGVFTDNPVPEFVNGSLWTLKYELLCYLTTALLGVWGLLKGRSLAFIFITSSLANCLIQTGSLDSLINWNQGFPFILKSFLELYPYFVAGAWIYIVRDRLPFQATWAYGALFLLALSLPIVGLLKPVFSIAGAYLVIYLAYFPHRRPVNINRFGDLSYGIYIYGWPIQQIVVQWLHPQVNWLTNSLISLPIILGLAWLSWHGIEKPAMRYKSKKTNTSQTFPAPAVSTPKFN